MRPRYSLYSQKERSKIVREVGQQVLYRNPRMCNFIEWKDKKLIYRRYASLYFCLCVSKDENELLMLEVIHRYCVVMDLYFGSVCELDIVFNFEQAYLMLDEFIMAGEIQETSLRVMIKSMEHADATEKAEYMERSIQ